MTKLDTKYPFFVGWKKKTIAHMIQRHVEEKLDRSLEIKLLKIEERFERKIESFSRSLLIDIKFLEAQLASTERVIDKLNKIR